MPSTTGREGKSSRKPSQDPKVGKIVIKKEKGKLKVLKDQNAQKQVTRVSKRSTKTTSSFVEEPSELDSPKRKLPKLRIPTSFSATHPPSPSPVAETQVVINPECPICRRIISGDINDVNEHIDGCLEPYSETEGESVMEPTPTVVGPELDALPMAAVNIEGDESRYGAPQYTVADVQRIIKEARKNMYKCGRDEELKPILETDSRETLLERIKLLEGRLESSSARCLICLDSFVNPVVSTVCWHVCCEVCWCQTLGSKRLCPQCNRITSPDDLRRIYF